MSAPRFNHFFCPHCHKRFAKDDPAVAGADMHRAIDEMMGVGGVLATLNESVDCPNPKCGKRISLKGIFEGRYDSPPMSLMGCVLTILFFIVAIVVWNIIRNWWNKPH